VYSDSIKPVISLLCEKTERPGNPE